jgi:glycosidase
MKSKINKEFHAKRTLNLLLVLSFAIFLISCESKEAKNTEQGEAQTIENHYDWSKNANIYEVNIRQYTPEGTFKAFQEDLPRLKEMGVDILWLMPIYPIGELNRKGTLGSYYSIKDYKAINPEFGTMEDFKHLVKKVHEMGMKLILDWVANHTSWDNSWIKEHPEWYTRDSLGNFVAPYDWTDVADLNYDNKEMRDAMIDALKFWVVEADVDGYRCDVAGEVPTDFWEEAVSELREIKPVFMLAESEEPEHHNEAFDMTYAWELHHLMNMIAKGEAPADTIVDYYERQDKRFPPKAYRMIFTSNHDENSWNGTEFERMGDGAQAFAVLSATLPGMPLIYSGQEAAFDRRLEFFEKDQIDWGDYSFEEFYTSLLKLKHENEALWNGEFGGKMIVLETGAPEDVLAFVRQKNDNKVLVLTNLSPEVNSINIESGLIEGNYKDLFTGKASQIDSSLSITLDPWEYRVLVKE